MTVRRAPARSIRQASPATPATPAPPLELPETAWVRRDSLRSPQHSSANARQVAESVVIDRCLVLPPFQRPYVWSDAQVIRLFDSLLRGFPVGSLLLWQRALPSQHVSFGGIEVTTKGGYDTFVVIDGQQRIAAMTNMVHAPRFHVHLLRGELLVNPEPDAWIVPARLLFCYEAIFEYVPAHCTRWSLDRRVVDRLVAMMMSTIDHAYVSVVRLEARYTSGEVVELFTRLNREGTPMAAEDLAHALSMLPTIDAAW